MHFIHDKHSYFFEKYLRKEMDAEETAAFEEKLNNDAAFKADFDQYCSHHEEILKQELNEYKEEFIPDKPEKRTRSWILIALSLLAIILLFDYYLNKRYKEEHSDKPLQEKVFNRINDVLIKPLKFKRDSAKTKESGRKETTATKPERPKEDTLKNVVTGDSTLFELAEKQMDELSSDPRYGLNVKDVLLLDTMLNVLEWDKFKSVKVLNDSLAIDSCTAQGKMSNKTAERSIIKTVYVEIWRSAIGYKGYKFNGKKLLLFGLTKPFDIVLLRQGERVVLRIQMDEIALENDNEFHKLY